ncbi:PAS domain S-box protein [Methanocalculus sp. MC3]
MQSPGSDDPSISLLYVDDEPALLEIGKAFLERSAGIRVDTQETAIDALRLLETQSYDAIVSDYQMPDMDGIVFLKALRERGDTTPFIIFTGKGREEVVIEAFDAGADFYLQKGGDPRSQFAELERKVRRAVDLHRAERATRESEERFKRVMSLVPDMISIHDPEMTILYSNWMGFGAVPEEKRQVQTKCYRTYRDYDDICPDCQAKEVLASKEPVHREVLLPDGRWIDLRVIPVLDADGNVDFFLEWVRDISEMKRSNSEISDVQRLLQGMLDGVPDIIGLQRPDHTIIRYNKAGYDALNLTPEEVDGRRCYELIGRDEPCEICATTEAVATGKAVTIEKFVPEMQKYFQCTSNPVFGEDGNLELVIERLHDISDQKMTEEALRKSEEKYRTLVDRASQMLFLHDQYGAILDVNQKAIESTGYSREELLSMNVADIDPDADKRDDKRLIWQETPLTEERFFETRHRRKDGSIYPAEVHASRVTIAGEPCIMGLATDITSRKQEEAALQESEGKFRGIIENLQDIYYRTDADGIVTMLSPSAAGIFGYDTPDTMMGKPASDFWVYPEERKEILRRIAEEGGVRDYEVTLKKADGSFLPVSVSCRQIYDGSGKPAGIEGVIRDITERKEAEERIKESEEKYRLIADNTADTIWIADLNLKIQYISPSVLKMRGYTPEEVMGQSLQEMLTPGSFESVQKQFAAEMALEATGKADPERTIHIEFEKYRKDGSTILVENAIRFLRDHDGQPTGIIGVSRDITERKEVEKLIKQSNDRLKTVINSIDAFIYIADMETYEVLFQNEHGRNAWGNVEGAICWKSLQHGQDGPCPFCTNDKLLDKDGKPAGVYIWQFQNTVNGRWYECRDVAIQWIDGRIVRMEIATDITERKEAEERIKESEEKYRLIADNTADNIWIFDMDFSLRYISPSVLLMKGFTVEESLAQTIEEVMTPASYAALRDRFNKEMEAEALGTADPDRTVSFETEEYCRDGSTILVENSTRLLRDEEGKPVGILGVSRDITKRKEMERALKSQLDLIEGLFESLPLGVIIFDTGGTILRMNRGVEEITGYSAEEIPTVGDWFLRTYPDPAYRDEVIATWESDKEGEVRSREFKVTCKDGTIKDIEFHAVFLTDGRIIVTISDVTERRRAEKEKEKNEYRFSIMANQSRAYTWEIDAEGLYTSISPEAEAITGYKPEEIVGRMHFYELHPEKEREGFKQRAMGIIARRETFTEFENCAHKKNGETIWVSTSGIPIEDDSGRLIGYWGTDTDITERKLSEDALQMANKKLQILASITRHDIQNRIMALLGYLDLTKMEIDDPRLSKYLGEIERAGSDIQRQIEFTRTYQELGVERAAWHAIDDLLSPISGSELPLIADCTGYQVLADPMIERVFSNLMDNTIRHAHDATRVGCRCEERDGQLAIIWEDDGAGVPEDQKKRIFERGYGENTGLGLFLSREILAITGITIEETGEYGKGARFEMLVPAGAWQKSDARS